MACPPRPPESFDPLDDDFDDGVARDFGDLGCDAPGEPTGSCEECGGNLYEDDDDGLCGQCDWFGRR